MWYEHYSYKVEIVGSTPTATTNYLIFKLCLIFLKNNVVLLVSTSGRLSINLLKIIGIVQMI